MSVLVAAHMNDRKDVVQLLLKAGAQDQLQEVCTCFLVIRTSVDALCRDDTSEISRDPRTKRLQTRRESLARPSKHTNNNF